MDYAWTCGCCGKQHSTLPLDFAVPAPDAWIGLPEAEREHRGRLDTDLCVIDGKYFFTRGCVEIPIVKAREKFVLGMWTSVSKESFDRILDLWDEPIVENEPPKFGWLNNNLPVYPPTLSLKAHVHLRGGGLRPFIELEPTDHPLAVEQRQGITLRRVEELANALMPRH